LTVDDDLGIQELFKFLKMGMWRVIVGTASQVARKQSSIWCFGPQLRCARNRDYENAKQAMCDGR
jgi:hypothetical protein